MRAKPGRPRKAKRKPAARPAVRPEPQELPANLTPDQRRQLDELRADPRLDTTGLLDQYISTLRLRDKAERQLNRGLVIGTERGARKPSPAWTIYNSCCDRLLRLREMMAKQGAATLPAGPASGGTSHGDRFGLSDDTYEQNVQRVLAGEFDDRDGQMELLIDDQDPEGPRESWKRDPRVDRHLSDLAVLLDDQG